MISLGPTPLRRDKLRIVRRREGRYLLRSNLPNEDPATLWQYYIRLTEIEQAFKELKHDLAVRPIYHQTDKRIEAHIFRSRGTGSDTSGTVSRRHCSAASTALARRRSVLTRLAAV